jgi:hypothetical protein
VNLGSGLFRNSVILFIVVGALLVNCVWMGPAVFGDIINSFVGKCCLKALIIEDVQVCTCVIK